MRCIEIYEKRWLQLHNERPVAIEATLLSATRRFWEAGRMYGEDGNLWWFEPTTPPRVSLVGRFFAGAIFYNPKRAIPMSYRYRGTYALSDLKAVLWPSMAAMAGHFFDDEEEEAMGWFERLERAKDFDEVVGTVSDYLHLIAPTLRIRRL